MPLVRISVSRQLKDDQVAHISSAVHDALIANFNVPPHDRFQVITRCSPKELIYAPAYLGIAHGETFALIQITANQGRTVEMKKALFAQIASTIAAGGAVPAADVFINLVEVVKENWSFGNGIAQYAD
jgi:phenylpyruvate tautomerase PptA (4-oxalocrotonate tautomerase family)